MKTKTLTLKETFTLSIVIKRSEIRDMEEILIDNGWPYQINKTAYPAFMSFEIGCNLRRAEAIRQLLSNSNITVYNE
jgi:hypothetical protein